MGTSLPPSAGADLVNSYARRVGDDVEVVLAATTATIVPGDLVVLRRGERRVSATPEPRQQRHHPDHAGGSEGGEDLVARFPRAGLTDGTWRVRLRTAGGPVPLGCRLLVQGERPVVLLWGDDALPSTLPQPRPRPSRPSQPAGPGNRVRGAVGRLRRLAGSVLRSG